MDRKAPKAQKHSEELKRSREQTLIEIKGYHKHIDNCTAEIKDCENKIEEYHSRIRIQQETIRIRWVVTAKKSTMDRSKKQKQDWFHKVSRKL